MFVTILALFPVSIWYSCDFQTENCPPNNNISRIFQLQSGSRCLWTEWKHLRCGWIRWQFSPKLLREIRCAKEWVDYDCIHELCQRWITSRSFSIRCNTFFFLIIKKIHNILKIKSFALLSLTMLWIITFEYFFLSFISRRRWRSFTFWIRIRSRRPRRISVSLDGRKVQSADEHMESGCWNQGMQGRVGSRFWRLLVWNLHKNLANT